MNVILLAAAFLLICIGVAVIAAIPFLFALARRHDEIASNLGVQTQFHIKRYNSIIEAHNEAARARKAAAAPQRNLRPINGGINGNRDGPDDKHPKK